jgi:hypothetical protein
VAAPWLPIAGKMNGFIPCDFQYSTTDRTMVAMLVIPRLPTPIATREPGLNRDANGADDSSLRTVAGMSRIALSGKF